MMQPVLEVAAGLCLLVGAAFALVGAIGVLRFPDVFTRMHASSKAGTLGSGFCLLAVALLGGSFDVTTRAIAGILFFMLTAPVSAHLLARAAFLAGYRSNCVANAYVEGSASPTVESRKDQSAR